MSQFVRSLLIFAIAIGACFSSLAQDDKETEVKVYQKTGSRLWSCYRLENNVYDEPRFNELIKNKDCSHLKELKIDFAKQSLIGFQVQGDCLVSGRAKVFRDDQAQTYQVRIKNVSGGCRAAGAYTSWLVIDKIPAGYKVEFTETRIDDPNYRFDTDTEKNQPETRQSRQIDIQGCIRTYLVKSFIIKDETSFLKEVRHDASRERCLKNIEKIDFEKNSLLGIEINSGYCRRPLGLEFEALKNTQDKRITLRIGYLYPKGALCRALSQYDLWVLVPKIPEGYEVKFEVRAKLD